MHKKHKQKIYIMSDEWGGGARIRQMDLLLFQYVHQLGLPALEDETLKAESVALVEYQWRALQLVADRNGLGAALRWQLVEPERLTSALGKL